MYLFNHPNDLIDFIVCGIFCGIYFLINISIAPYFIQKYSKDLNINRSLLLESNLYALIMSTPVMPFLFLHTIYIFYSGSISLFAFSYLLWQSLYLNTHKNASFNKIIMSLSLINITAWAAISLLNYWFFAHLTKGLYELLLNTK